jgi:tribbles-like protein 3
MERYGNFVVNPVPISCTTFRRGVILGPPTQQPTVILALVLKTSEASARFAEREAAVYALLRRLPHPHAARVVADHIITTAGQPSGRLVVLPASEGSNLATVLSMRGPMPLPLACRTILQVAAAVAHCHMHGIVLRGINVGAIFFADAQRRCAVLADLTGAQVVLPHARHPGRAWVTDKCDITAYASPELLRKRAYDACAADVYALGVVFFTALTGIFPFFGSTPAHLYARIVAGPVAWPAGLAPPVLALLKSMMDRNPTNRPTAASIVALPWLAGLVAEMGAPLPGAPMSAIVAS